MTDEATNTVRGNSDISEVPVEVPVEIPAEAVAEEAAPTTDKEKDAE